MNWSGILLGASAFVIIGVFHPIVIKAEYHLGKRCWWMFALAGAGFCIASILSSGVVSAILGVVGFSCFWSILELFEQEKRVAKGWFPANPTKKNRKINLPGRNAVLNVMLTLVMGLMVTFGNELIRYNPSNRHIEYSNNRGSSWYVRSTSTTIGNVKSLITYGNELILCSDKGVFYSNNKGASWYLRSTAHKDFTDLQDAGNEILAGTSDGHIYYSNNKGSSWYKRR